MRIFYIIVFFILGTIMGSFYHVIATRIPNHKSIIKPRSSCVNCHHTLKFYEMIPVLSYIFLRGKCSACHKPIGLMSFASELFTGILFAISFYSFSFSYDFLIAISLSSLFIIVMITDLNYYIIPDGVNITFAIIILILTFLKYGLGGFLYLLNGIILFVFMYLLMLIGNALFKEESLGGGDIKLSFTLGMTMPIILSFISLATACILALPMSIYLLIKKNDKVVPLGPFLVAAFLLIMMFKIDVTSFYQYFIF